MPNDPKKTLKSSRFEVSWYWISVNICSQKTSFLFRQIHCSGFDWGPIFKMFIDQYAARGFDWESVCWGVFGDSLTWQSYKLSEFPKFRVFTFSKFQNFQSFQISKFQNKARLPKRCGTRVSKKNTKKLNIVFTQIICLNELGLFGVSWCFQKQ